MKKKLQNYTDIRGNLFSYYKKNLKFNRVFFITGKKIKSEVIMHTKVQNR